MLQVKSFEMTDGEGMSAFLQTYRIAEGANMLISNGIMCIPYEDGKPMNPAQTAIMLQSEKNGMGDKVRMLLQSQRVLEIQIEGIDGEISKLQPSEANITPKNKKVYDESKASSQEIKRLENVKNQTKMTMLMNQAEITRLMTNIKVYDEMIAEVQKA